MRDVPSDSDGRRLHRTGHRVVAPGRTPFDRGAALAAPSLPHLFDTMFQTTTPEAPMLAQHSASAATTDPAIEIQRAIAYLKSALEDLRAQHPESAATYLLEARRHGDNAFEAITADPASQ